MMATVTQSSFVNVLKAVRDGSASAIDRAFVVSYGDHELPGRITVKGKDVAISFGPESSFFPVPGLYSDDRLPCESTVTINDGAEKAIRAILGKGASPVSYREVAKKILLERSADGSFFDEKEPKKEDFWGEEEKEEKKKDFFDDPGAPGGTGDVTDPKMVAFLSSLPKTVGFRGKITADKLDKGKYEIVPNQAIEVLKLLNLTFEEAIEIFMRAADAATTALMKGSIKFAAAEAVGFKDSWVEASMSEAVSTAQQGHRDAYSYFGVMNVAIAGGMAKRGRGAVFHVIPAS